MGRRGGAATPLRWNRDSSLVLSTIAQALGVWEESSPPLLERMQARLHQAVTLLVLDNFEYVWPNRKAQNPSNPKG